MQNQTDYQKQLDEYLLNKLKQQNDPNYGKRERDEIAGIRENDVENARSAALMKAAAQMGTIGGKTADASPVADMASSLARSNQMRLGEIQDKRQQEDKQFGMNADVYKYLAEKQRKAAESAAMADYRKKDLEQKQLSSKAAMARAEADKKESSRRWEETNSRLNQQVTDNRQDKLDAKADKEAQYQAGVKVDGTAVKDGFRPTLDSAKKAKDAKTAYDKINMALDEMDRIYNRSGTNLVGDDASRMASLKTSMLMAQKELDALGVLSGQDERLTMDQIPDPTSWAENAKGFFGMDRYGSKSSQYRQNLKNQYDAALGAGGYVRTDPDKKSLVGDEGTAIADDKAPKKTKEDDVALTWARSNPNDPRAKEILRLNGGQ